MFCGLPISVAADPALLAPASAMRKGRGSSPRARVPAISSGAIAKVTTSVASSADSPPHTATVQPSSMAGLARFATIQSAHRS